MTNKLSLHAKQRNKALFSSVFFTLSLFTVMLFSSLVQAHQIKAAITTVFFNPRTENIEVMHRFNLHDAEHAVKALFDKHADIMDDDKAQEAFSDYIARHFTLLNSDEMPLELEKVGYEVEGKYFWIYQETAVPPTLDGLKIRHDALRDLWPTQVNTLNVEGKGDIKTLTFADNVTLLEVSFKGEQDH